MGIKKILRAFKDSYLDIKQRHQNKKSKTLPYNYLVISSDDWGSIRTPSLEAYLKAHKDGKDMDTDPFLKYDCLESKEDVCLLIDILKQHSNSKGEHPIITANFAMANPSFDNIDPQKGIYQRELFYETYSRYEKDGSILEEIKKSKDSGLFIPQLHCLEHLRVHKWMNDLLSNEETQYAFNNKMVGTFNCYSKTNSFGYMDELNYSDADFEKVSNEIILAAKVFEDVFGYRSKSFVPSCNVWKDDIYSVLAQCGISIIQCGNHQFRPSKNGRLRKRNHFTSQKNCLNQCFVVRNCYLEHIFSDNPVWAAKNCFKMVDDAFKVGVPAIVDSHRVNYVGGIFKENREKGLKMLDSFLTLLLEKYPDVKFVSIEELGEILNEN